MDNQPNRDTGAPAEETARHSDPAAQTMHVNAPLYDVKQHGNWTPPQRIEASAGEGAVELDFVNADIVHDQITVDARPNWNRVEIIVPRGFDVTTEQAAPDAKPVHDLTTAKPRAGAPHLHVLARGGMGKVLVRHPRARSGLSPLRLPGLRRLAGRHT